MSFQYDLHLHSCASHDCRTSYPSLIRMAARRGLSGIALTDHDTMDGVKRLSEIWPHDTLQLIPGCERTLQDGSHIIGLFLTQTLLSDTVREAAAEIREQGGLIYFPHPYRRYSGALGRESRIGATDREWLLEQADIIEIFNAKCTPEENRLALDLLIKSPKSFAASSDAHFAHEVGYAYTSFAVRLSPTAFTAAAAFAPTASAAARIAWNKNKPADPPVRALVKKTIRALGLLPAAKTIKNHWSCCHRPPLERVR